MDIKSPRSSAGVLGEAGANSAAGRGQVSWGGFWPQAEAVLRASGSFYNSFSSLNSAIGLFRG